MTDYVVVYQIKTKEDFEKTNIDYNLNYELDFREELYDVWAPSDEDETLEQFPVTDCEEVKTEQGVLTVLSRTYITSTSVYLHKNGKHYVEWDAIS